MTDLLVNRPILHYLTNECEDGDTADSTTFTKGTEEGHREDGELHSNNRDI